jgi:hypothetical protein
MSRQELNAQILELLADFNKTADLRFSQMLLSLDVIINENGVIKDEFYTESSLILNRMYNKLLELDKNK